MVTDGFPVWAPDLAVDSIGFDPENFATLAEIEAGNFWFRSRNQLIRWAVDTYFPQSRSFLEIGCGTGFVVSELSRSFPNMRCVGSEVFTEGLMFAAARTPGAEFLQMDARRSPFVEEFDLVGAFDVIEHIDDDETVLRAMFECVIPGGGALITVPQHPRLWSPVDEHARHERRYTARELHAKVRAAGFDILRSTSFVALLLPAMLASRLRTNAAGDPDPMDEFRVGPVLNGALEGVLSFERFLITRGVDFPIGGSRLVVARRPL